MMTNCCDTTALANSETAERTADRQAFRPRVDIVEDGNRLILLADVPGANDQVTDVSLDRNVLTIRGSVSSPEFEGYSPAWTEYNIGDFERTFTISKEIDRDAIEATVHDGVLQVVLPKRPDAGVRKISVKAGQTSA